MRNTSSENISEHSLQVAMVAHALALLRQERLTAAGAAPPAPVSPERVALLALFHDADEVITGDLPSPIKYFNPAVRDAVAGIAEVAREKLLAMVPAGLRPHYRPLLTPQAEDEAAWQLVKHADKICAYLKCVEEQKMGNREFERAQTVIERSLGELGDPDVERFLELYLPSFSLTLDELN